MRKRFSDRVEDSTFELNLAPMLDIIVSIVPMLLMSVAFIHLTVIETPIPQAVEKAIAAAQDKKDQAQILLRVSKSQGFHFTVTDKGETKEFQVAMKGTEFDLDGLHTKTLELKKLYPDVFRLELNPEENVPLNDIVAVRVRQSESFTTLVEIANSAAISSSVGGLPWRTAIFSPALRILESNSLACTGTRIVLP